MHRAKRLFSLCPFYLSYVATINHLFSYWKRILRANTTLHVGKAWVVHVQCFQLAALPARAAAERPGACWSGGGRQMQRNPRGSVDTTDFKHHILEAVVTMHLKEHKWKNLCLWRWQLLARIYPALLLAVPGTAVRACEELQHCRSHNPALASQMSTFHSSAWHRLPSLHTRQLHTVCLSSDNCQQAQTDLAIRMHPKP